MSPQPRQRYDQTWKPTPKLERCFRFWSGARRAEAGPPDLLRWRSEERSGRVDPAACFHALSDVDGIRLCGLIVVLWRAGLRISEALALTESDLDAYRGAILVRHGLCRIRHSMA